eukprot:gene5531-6216_t
MGLSLSRKRKNGIKPKSKHRGRQIILSGDVCLDHFEILRSIGRGSFGKVCIVQKKDTEQLYALKYMNKQKCYSQNATEHVLKELTIMKNLDHSHLVNLWFAFQDDEDMFMVLDLMLGGDIRYHLNEGRRFNEQQILMYIAEVSLALDYLRSHKIVHRDIKPDNLLLDDKGHVHLADFNIAAVLKEEKFATSLSGTKGYMAPEIFATCLCKSKGYSYPVDWWSLGITVCEMIRGRRPFEIYSETPVKDAYEIFTSELVLELPNSISDDTVRLIKKLLQPHPRKRLCRLDALKAHVSMEGIDFESVKRKECLMSFVPSRDHLNCDPTYELEEMIIESKPLHKKKKRMHRKLSHKVSADSQSTIQSTDPYVMDMPSANKSMSTSNADMETDHQSEFDFEVIGSVNDSKLNTI